MQCVMMFLSGFTPSVGPLRIAEIDFPMRCFSHQPVTPQVLLNMLAIPGFPQNLTIDEQSMLGTPSH